MIGSPSKLGVGIVGCGNIAAVHARIFNSLKETELIGVADIDKTKLKRFQEKHKAVFAYDNLDALLKNPSVNVVSICTPHHLHAGMAHGALRSRKHVLLEKPLALNMRDADALVREANGAKVVFSVISQYRFDPAFFRAKEMIDAKTLGRIKRVRIFLDCGRDAVYYNESGAWRSSFAESGGGVVFTQLYHVLDILSWYFGPPSRINKVQLVTLAHKIEVEDTAFLKLEFFEGIDAEIIGSTASSYNWALRFEINGTRGSLVVDGTVALRLRSKGGILRRRGCFEEGSVGSCVRRQGRNRHKAQIMDFVNAIIQKKEPRVPPAVARETLRMILAVYANDCNSGKKVMQLC